MSWALLDRAVLACGRVTRGAMLGTAGGRLRFLWRALYAVIIHGVTGVLRVAGAEAVYVRGSFAVGEPVYGLSDVDMIAIAGGEEAAQRLRARVRGFYARVPTVRNVVDVTVLASEQLAEACFSPFMTDVWDPATRAPVRRARFFGRRSTYEPFGLRPDGSVRLYGPTRPWRCLAGRDPNADLPRSPDVYRWLWSWLDLQFVWRHAFRTCANPSSPQAAYFCTKMVAEPARTWLWLSRDSRLTHASAEVLEEALRLMPEEERMLRAALVLRRSLHSSPAPPLGAALTWLCRLSARFADRLAAEMRSAGAVEVRLIGHGDQLVPTPQPSAAVSRLAPGAGIRALPLVDWRARVVPERPDEALVLLPVEPTDPRELGAVARAHTGSPHPALHSGNLLVLPTARSGVWPLATASLRAIQCPASDPVSFALLEGRRAARFPNLPGWSARECAERAVLEHRAWLRSDEHREPLQRRLGMLLSAARAAAFAESVDSGDPELALTMAAAAESLAARSDSGRDVAQSGFDEYRRSHATGEDPAPGVVAALSLAIRALPCYSAPAESAPSPPAVRAV